MSIARGISSSQKETRFGGLLSPISQLTDQLTIKDLIASKQNIHDYLVMVNEPQPIDIIQEQPTPLGMALIASYYNDKNDHHGCRIYIASTVEDLRRFATQINLSEGDRAIVIFQPTDLELKSENNFYSIHKVTIYFEKTFRLNILIADSTPFVYISQITIDLLEVVLKDIPRNYYTQKIAKLPEDSQAICMQGDYWSCGTHAFRIARFISKNPNFLAELSIASTAITDQDQTKSHFEYLTPPQFLKLADTKIARSKAKTFFGAAYDHVNQHFVRYEKDFAYVTKFTQKYISLITGFLVSKSMMELLQRIQDGNAGNYQPPMRSLRIR